MVNPISVIIAVVANLFVIYVEYHKNKKITRIHLLIFCVPISIIIFALTTHMMITLTNFGICLGSLCKCCRELYPWCLQQTWVVRLQLSGEVSMSKNSEDSVIMFKEKIKFNMVTGSRVSWGWVGGKFVQIVSQQSGWALEILVIGFQLILNEV